MGSPNRRLPRGPHAAKPGPDEVILKRSGADLQNGWLSRHGDLMATDDRLVFLPTILDTLLGAKRREIALDDISEIERFPVSPNGGSLGGRRPRMLVHTTVCVYEIMVSDLDAWIDSLERLYVNRAKSGRTHKPTITREDYTNLLLVED
jgi:hypothetical protein